MILVTGASGKLGRAVMEELLMRVPADRLIAGSRTPRDATERGGVESRFVDFDDPGSLRAAREGVDTVLVIPTAEREGHRRRQHLAAVEAFASVPVVAYAGIIGADVPDDNALLETHALAEASLRARRQSTIVFRNGVYLESLPMLLGSALQTGVIEHPAGNGKVSWILRSELAIAIATRLTQPVTQGCEMIPLVGDEAHGFAELATHASAIVKRAIRYAPVAVDAYRTSLAALGMSPHAVAAYVDVCAAIAAGRLESRSPAASRLLGRSPTGALQYLASALASTPGT